jgi:hypothetical protein
MRTHTKINLVLMAMVSLCLGSVMAAQAPTTDAVARADAKSSLSAPISQRAEALALDVLVEREPTAPADNAISALAAKPDTGRSARHVSEIEMPFFSFGSLGGAE